MRLDLAFRLSTYLSLGSAVACLAYAEDKYVPGVGWFGLAVGVLLVVAFFLEGRWSLPLAASNFVGAAIALGTVLWVFYRLIQLRAEIETPFTTPWPAVLLPYLGPLLMVLLLAKLLRPKQLSDYWMLQVIALLQIALAAALANDPQDSDLIFGLLLLGYAVFSVWWLLLCNLTREPATTAVSTARRPKVPWRLLGLQRAVTWLAATGVIGLVLFLMTPRVSSLQQPFVLNAPTGASATTGYTDSIDLNVTGQVAVNNEVAFQVVAAYERIRPGQKPEHPKLDVSSDQRWRGASLNYYDSKKGQWRAFAPANASKSLASATGQGAGRRLQLPEPVPGQASSPPPPAPSTGQDYFLLFSIRPKLTHGVLVADPVLQRGETYISVWTVAGDGLNDMLSYPWQQDQGGTPKPSVVPSGSTYYYLQRARSPVEPGLTPVPRPRRDYIDQISAQPPLPRLRPWTMALLRRLAAEKRYNLTERDLEADEAGFLPRRWEKVARALKGYLVSSGEFGYTLNLRRQDLSIDPVEDFLFNVKEGHCERFATALTLMLRSVGIPARVVLGYQGAEHQSEGLYIVRQSDAHSWVEVLIERPVNKSAYPRYYWLALDPTPPDKATTSAARTLLDWAGDGWRYAQTAWRDFVIGYNFEAQNNLGATLEVGLDHPRTAGFVMWRGLQRSSFRFWAVVAAAGIAIVMLLVGIRMVRRRWGRGDAKAAQRAPSVAFYARWLDLLARHLQLQPGRAQTAREFAAGTGPVLAGALADPALAALPDRMAESFYRIRFGGRPLDNNETHALQRQLDEIEALLAARLAAPAGSA